MLAYTIDDPIRDPLSDCVEVTVDFGGRKGWLLFATPQHLAAVGSWVDGTRTPYHLGERHMIVVGLLTEDIIDRVLRRLDADGELESRTLPLGP